MLTMVFIADLSGFPDAVRGLLRTISHGRVDRVKPLDCSLCLTWWVCLVYSLLAGAFRVEVVAYIALLALMARPVADVVNIVLELINKGINFICRICRI